MRLLIKQRVFSWSDTYDVYDEEGNVRYFVRAEVFALGHQIHVYDAARFTARFSLALQGKLC